MGGYVEVWDSLRQLEINSSRSHLFKATIQGKVQYAGGGYAYCPAMFRLLVAALRTTIRIARQIVTPCSSGWSLRKGVKL